MGQFLIKAAEFIVPESSRMAGRGQASNDQGPPAAGGKGEQDGGALPAIRDDQGAAAG